MPVRIKGRKMDANLVSSQVWEISYIAKRFGVKPETVRKARKEAGKSRRAVYSYLRSLK